MTIDQAIDILCNTALSGANKDMANIEQAVWTAVDGLIALKRIMASGDCNECDIKNVCQVVPPLGEQVRYNCPLFVRKEQEEGGEE